jgi:hypothetical protein
MDYSYVLYFINIHYSYVLYIYAIDKSIKVVNKLRLELFSDHTLKNLIA